MKRTLQTFLLIVLLVASMANLSVFPARSQASIVRVQGNIRSKATSGSSFTVTLADPPTAGNLLILAFGGYSGSPVITVSSISQTGVSWSRQRACTWSDRRVEIWAGVVGSGAGTTITITLSKSISNGIVIADVCEYSGLATSDFKDQTAYKGGSQTTTTSTGTTATTTQADELWVGAIFAEGSSSVAQSNPTNGFTLLDGANEGYVYGGASLAYLEKIVSSTGQASSGTTLASKANEYAACIVTFKAKIETISIGDFEAPSMAYPDTYFLLNATIVAPNDVSEFVNTTVELENGIILMWDAATDTFSEYQDTNGYCTLDAAGSFKTQLNSTSYKLSWRIKLSSSFPSGGVDIVDADVYSETDHASNSEAGLFYFATYTGWWNDDWQKRALVIISENSGSTLTDHQMAINVTYDSDMQSDFDDLRFTWLNQTSETEVLCDAWLETKSDGAWAYIWVEVLEIPASDSTVLFMYYGNSSVSSYWNSTATFIFFDDFTDLSKWTVDVGTTPPISSEHAYTGTTSVKIDANSLGTIKLTHSFGESLTNVVVEGRHYDDASITDQADAFTVYDGASMIRIGNDNDYTNIAYYDTAWHETSVPRQTGWNHIKICIASSGADGYYRGIQIFTDNPTITQIDSMALAAWDGTYHSVVYYDTILVRKFADPEPSYSVGSEESPAQNLIVTGCYFSTGQQITVKGYVYYEGTTTPPSESVTVYVEYGSSVKASTSSLTNGLFTLSWTESSAGLRTYTIYAVAASDGRVSVQNQTVQALSFSVDSQFRWGFSNDTIASLSWDDTHKRLNVTFSSPASSKLYIYGRPTYILGETFDLGTDYSAGWTQLDLNQTTSVVSAHTNWGDFYVRKLTAGEVTDAYWTDQVFTLTLNGTSGTSATLEIYCGSRGMPKSWTGFTGDPTYDADTTILSGTVTYQSPVTVTLDYTIPTSSGSSAGGGGSSSSSAGLSILPTVSLSIAPVQLIQMHPGETVTGMLSINFTGVNNIRVLSLEFLGAAADWITLAEPLPKTIFKPIGEEVGMGEIELRIIVPENAQPGDYAVPVVVKAEAVGSQIQANGYLTFSITPQAPPVSLLPEYMTWIFAAALIAIVAYAYLKD